MKMISNFGIFYRLLVLSTIIFLFGCQSTSKVNVIHIGPPDWVFQNEYKEYSNDNYFVVVGVSCRSFEDARLEAYDEIKRFLGDNIFAFSVYLIGSDSPFEPCKYLHDFENGDEEIIRSLIDRVLWHLWVDQTSLDANTEIVNSWIENFVVEHKRDTGSHHQFYVLVTFDIKRALNDKFATLIKAYKNGIEDGDSNFESFLNGFFANIQIVQAIWFRYTYFKKHKEKFTEETKPDFDIVDNASPYLKESIITLLRDFEVKFSKDNIETQRDEFSEKIDIQVFWKKKLIKVPLRFETSTDAQVELIESKKDDVSYEMRIMPLSVSSRKNESGEYYVEFNFKPEGLRFSELINFALKKKLHFQVIDAKK